MASETKPYNPELFERGLLLANDVPGYDTDITLRDLFAAYAMNGLYSRHEAMKTTPTFEQVAHTAYDMADAMLTEREKK